jgi:hypothetical protein
MEFLHKDEYAEVIQARSYRDLARIARRVLKRLKSTGKPVVMVCGPIRSGGAFLRKGHDYGEAKRMNRAELKGVIVFLSKQCAVFNQLPFLDRAEDLLLGRPSRFRETFRSYVNSLFPRVSRDQERRKRTMNEDRFRTEFHLPILQSGLIDTLYFLNGWPDSEGSRWYHDRAKELGIDIRHVIPVKKRNAGTAKR